MDRRTALKNIGLSLGYVVATPTVLSILQSCKSDIATWTPKFFTETQGHMIINLSDIILPKTEIAGALDVNVPEFMDIMLLDIAPDKEKALIKEGADAFAKKFQMEFKKEAIKGTKEEYEQLLGEYFNKSDEEQEAIFKMLGEEKPKEKEKLVSYLIYKFLMATRRYTLFGYYTSEHVGENILSYDPIPGKWEPCIPVEKVGNAWSL